MLIQSKETFACNSSKLQLNHNLILFYFNKKLKFLSLSDIKSPFGGFRGLLIKHYGQSTNRSNHPGTGLARGNYDAETKAEVREMLDAEDKTLLIEAFYRDLEFGTGGLRGIMGAGTNRMNIYTVGAATQGFEQLPEGSVCLAATNQCGHWSRLPQQQPEIC